VDATIGTLLSLGTLVELARQGLHPMTPVRGAMDT
jgi:hypothetical protein